MRRIVALLSLTFALQAFAQLTLPYGDSSSAAGIAFQINSSNGASTAGGIAGTADTNGTGVTGTSQSGVGVKGTSGSGFAIVGESTSGTGIQAKGSGIGLSALGDLNVSTSVGVSASGKRAGVLGDGDIGIEGTSSANTGKGVKGSGKTGVLAVGENFGVDATATGTNPVGIKSTVATNVAVGAYVTATSGSSNTVAVDAHARNIAVLGDTSANNDLGTSVAVRGLATNGMGVRGDSTASNGVMGASASSIASGVYGETSSGFGVAGRATSTSGTAIFGDNPGGSAGIFSGDIYATTASGGIKFFYIDHPGDPANKTLRHASIESSEYKNLYDGIALLDSNGTATISLPGWFEQLNKDFRYSLTPIGGPAQLYVSREISNRTFTIAGGSPGQKVSWQVTGIRKDAQAQAFPLVVEEDKPQSKRGFYLTPEPFAQPRSKAFFQGPQP